MPVAVEGLVSVAMRVSFLLIAPIKSPTQIPIMGGVSIQQKLNAAMPLMSTENTDCETPRCAVLTRHPRHGAAT